MVNLMKIGMSHGAGGGIMQGLISEIILGNLKNKRVNGGVGLDDLDDGATIPFDDYEIVISTDSHTVDPIFFPGGDIGTISIAGTVNDVSVMGAKPLAIANAMVISEGFSGDDFERIIKSMDSVCIEADVAIITGDTKVMEHDKLDKIIISTTGIGIVKKGEVIRDSGLKIAANIRKKLIRSASQVEGAATPEETLMIGQWMDSRHSQVESEEQYFDSVSGRIRSLDEARGQGFCCLSAPPPRLLFRARKRQMDKLSPIHF